MEVRERLVVRIKNHHLGQLTSSEPGDQSWLSQELGQARETRGGLEHRAARGGTTVLGVTTYWGKQEHGDRKGKRHSFPEFITRTIMNKLLHRHLYTTVFLITSHMLNLTDYFLCRPYSMMKKSKRQPRGN